MGKQIQTIHTLRCHHHKCVSTLVHTLTSPLVIEESQSMLLCCGSLALTPHSAYSF